MHTLSASVLALRLLHSLTTRSANPFEHCSHDADSHSPHGRIPCRAYEVDSFDRTPSLDDGLAHHQNSEQLRPPNQIFLPIAVPTPRIVVNMFPETCCLWVENVHRALRHA